MFKIGDSVIHPYKGAGVIVDIKRMPKIKREQKYYKIKMIDQQHKTTILVPVSHAEKIGMRTALSEKNLEKVWQTLSEHPMGLPARHKRRYEILEEKMGTGEIHKIAEVVRDLRWRSMQFNRLNVPGERIYKKAKRFLIGELALSQNIDMKVAEDQLDRILADKLSIYIAQV